MATLADTAAAPLRSLRRAKTGRPWLHLILTVALIITIAPFVWMLLASFLPNSQIRNGMPNQWPLPLSMDNYSELIATQDYTRYFLNSVVVSLAVVAGNIIFCSMVGYALAKIQFRGRNLIFVLVLGMLMIPGAVTFIPLFVLTSRLGLVNTYPGLILPYLVTPIGVFLMRQFIAGIPDDLLEAARLDGAGEFRTFFRIVLPLSGPAIATLSIMMFLFSWNNFLWPLVVAQSSDYYTLPVALALFSVGAEGTNHGLLMAGAVITILPILILFLFLQRFFTQGAATTGIK